MSGTNPFRRRDVHEARPAPDPVPARQDPVDRPDLRFPTIDTGTPIQPCLCPKGS